VLHTSIRGQAVYAILLIWLVIALGSCSDSTKPDTEYLGEYQVHVDHLEIPDTISTGDTLSLYIDGSTNPSGCLFKVRFDAARESHSLELTVLADVYKWVGSGPPPPCGVAWGEYEALPPFSEGDFRVIINQPDSSVMVDSVYVRS
jgi:hypothetical protein